MDNDRIVRPNVQGEYQLKVVNVALLSFPTCRRVDGQSTYLAEQ